MFRNRLAVVFAATLVVVGCASVRLLKPEPPAPAPAARGLTISQDEQAEYEHIVRLNDLLSLLKLQTEEYWAPRIAS